MHRVLLFVLLGLGTVAGAQDGPQIKGLNAQGPQPALAEKLKLFGQFIGEWECDVVWTPPDGSKQNGRCEWNWGWILEGRAVQDVFISHAEGAQPGAPAVEYGTGLRFYDPKLDAWHVIFVGPVRDNLSIFTARQVGDEIILDGSDGKARMGQWIFSEITKDSFRWRAQGSGDGGKTWHIVQEIHVRRVRASKP